MYGAALKTDAASLSANEWPVVDKPIELVAGGSPYFFQGLCPRTPVQGGANTPLRIPLGVFASSHPTCSPAQTLRSTDYDQTCGVVHHVGQRKLAHCLIQNPRQRYATKFEMNRRIQGFLRSS